MFTLTPPPIAMTRAELDARIRYLARAADRAEVNGFWLEAEEYRIAADACRDELAARSAPDLDALARDADVYGEVVYAEIAERR